MKNDLAHFKRRKHQKMKIFAIISIAGILFILGGFINSLETSIPVKRVTEGYALNVKF